MKREFVMIAADSAGLTGPPVWHLPYVDGHSTGSPCIALSEVVKVTFRSVKAPPVPLCTSCRRHMTMPIRKRKSK